MRFWDTSAVVPLCIDEPATRLVRSLTENDPSLAVWWDTRTECISALARRRRERKISPETERRARSVLEVLHASWAEILPVGPVRDRAERLLATHPLRTGDAFQLSAALVWARERPSGKGFVCFDDRLREAAEREGFRVFPE